MNITIFSGGSGSTQLIKGLRDICTTNTKITHIINLYDDGKSTGICRRVADVLGPSDMRKVHIEHYKAIVKNKHYDDKFDTVCDLYEKRYMFGNKKEDLNEAKNSIKKILNESYGISRQISFFIELIDEFFDLADYKGIYDFNDFSIINIIYAMMFRKVGIKETHL